MVDPLTITAIGGTLASGIGSMFGGSGPQYSMGTTEEDIRRALKRLDRGYGIAQDLWREGGTLGDFSFSGGGYTPGKEMRQDNIKGAYQDFLMDKGFSEEYAAKRAKTAKGLNKRKAFKNFLKESGDEYNLEVEGGKIKGVPLAEGFSFSDGRSGSAPTMDTSNLLKIALGGLRGGQPGVMNALGEAL